MLDPRSSPTVDAAGSNYSGTADVGGRMRKVQSGYLLASKQDYLGAFDTSSGVVYLDL